MVFVCRVGHAVHRQLPKYILYMILYWSPQSHVTMSVPRSPALGIPSSILAL